MNAVLKFSARLRSSLGPAAASLRVHLAKLFLLIRQFLGSVPGAIRGHLNALELIRVVVTALVAGGGVAGVLQALLAAVGTVFIGPGDAAVATTVITLVLEVVRRLGHGQPVPTS